MSTIDNKTTDADRALLAQLEQAMAEDWELVKDTAGSVASRQPLFDLAYRFGWHAASKYLKSQDAAKGELA